MEQVLKEADRAAADFAADPVHDLRVALRRCRSMAEGIQAIDPDPAWKKMRKMGKGLFASLGTLRDCQVLMEWTEKLGAPDDPVTAGLMQYCRLQEAGLKQQAAEALQQFDRKLWRSWARTLPRRAGRLRPGSEPFQSLALERWSLARRLHNAALKSDDPAAFHRLRIGLKKFRYVVENFLPQLHPQWAAGLKRMQDALGEIHDLDVLRETASQIGVLTPGEARDRWLERVAAERKSRIDQYVREMTGKGSLWQVWRAGLPRGAEARGAAFQKLRSWASYLDPDVGHSRLVARLALQLYDGLARIGLAGDGRPRSRQLLQAAAVVHEVGRSDRKKHHHKTTQQMVEKLDRPFPWTHQDLAIIASIARYHRGALPGHHQTGMRSLSPPARSLAQRLAGILRLADALDSDRRGAIRSINVSKPREFVVIRAKGLNNYSDLAERIARARHLLELSCGYPILVRPAPTRRKIARSA
jgi:exopolyphosphatase/guanosine-5'-triphosphate,3'-diphosphate pyrophosphatase